MRLTGKRSDVPLVAPWGKADVDTGASHHLAHHCADVAAVFLALARTRAYRGRLETAAGRSLAAPDLARLALLVFLHDVGKLAPGFQAKAQPPDWSSARPCGHVGEAVDLLLGDGGAQTLPARAAFPLGVIEKWTLDPDAIVDLARAALSHHGRPAPLEARARQDVAQMWRASPAYDPNQAAAEIGAVLPKWFPEAFAPHAPLLPSSPAFAHLFAGLTSLADWIGSDAERFPFAPKLDANYWPTALRRADAALDALGLSVEEQRAVLTAPPDFAAVSGFAEPNAQQSAIGAVDLGSRLTILEAETGAGKTEAALWRYAQLFHAGAVDALYFAVPTRAAAAQIHSRVSKAAGRLFKTADPEAVLAAPGYLRAGAAEGRRLPGWETRWDDQDDEARVAARWSAESSKRYLAARIAVGTVDQAMLGALTVKHAHLRAASLSRALLVIDEVHASDAFMTEVQHRLLRAHLEVGGFAMLMSATLGSVARAKWLGARQPSLIDAVATPYPAIWTDRSRDPIAVATEEARAKAVEIRAVASMAATEAAAQARAAAEHGARVLVIRNTVSAAIDTLLAIEAESPPADLLFTVGGVSTLHHSRFAPHDRKRLDVAVETALSTARDRAPAGRIVVGTQTLEQSLDIDADLLITDLCPIDVLLQRIGRLHRHRLARPVGFEAARCMVLTPERGLEPLLDPPRFENGLGGWEENGVLQGVYRDLCVLELTRALIHTHPLWSIPEMNRSLVEHATHPERIDALIAERGAPWGAARRRVLGVDLAQVGSARRQMIDRSATFGSLTYPSDEEKIRTRLGAEGARITFSEPFPGPFGGPVAELVLPAHWSRTFPVDAQPTVDEHTPKATVFCVHDQRFRYDRLGVQRHGVPQPPV